MQPSMSAPVSLDEAGLLTFGLNDENDPKNWSTARKCYLTMIVISLVVNATFASSAPSGTLQSISDDIDVSLEVSNLVTSLFLLGLCAGPFVWAPLSEHYGRRWIFHVSFALYIAFTFLCAFAPNFGGLLAGRFLAGAMSSAVLSNGPGLISDIWHPVARGNAMLMYIVATFVGPALGPVILGFVESTKGWRWTFYVLLMLSGVSEALFWTLPETLPSIILQKMARRIRMEHTTDEPKVFAPVEVSEMGLGSILKNALMRPWKLLLDPISFLVAVYYAVIYTLLYMLFSIYPIVFQQKRGWSPGVGGLPLIGVIVGACAAGLVLYMLNLKGNAFSSRQREAVPEDRLPAAMIGSVLFAISMFCFAWTAEFNSIPWIVPTIMGAFLAMSILLLFAAFINYLVDTYTEYAASAIAANTVLRSACGAAGPLFAQNMFDSLGVGGGGSLIGGVAVGLIPIPFVFYRHGKEVKQRSKYARGD